MRDRTNPRGQRELAHRISTQPIVVRHAAHDPEHGTRTIWSVVDHRGAVIGRHASEMMARAQARGEV